MMPRAIPLNPSKVSGFFAWEPVKNPWEAASNDPLPPVEAIAAAVAHILLHPNTSKLPSAKGPPCPR